VNLFSCCDRLQYAELKSQHEGNGGVKSPVLTTVKRWHRAAFAASLLGEQPTLADITAGTSLYRYFELEIERPALPQVERWYRTLQQRPVFRDHVMIPFEELRGRLDY
jgi:hypothetical protein